MRNSEARPFHGGVVSAREDLVAYGCGVAPVEVQSQKARPSCTRGMHYAERDDKFAQLSGTVGAEIWRALPQN